jgi:hypothetical protein
MHFRDFSLLLLQGREREREDVFRRERSDARRQEREDVVHQDRVRDDALRRQHELCLCLVAVFAIFVVTILTFAVIVGVIFLRSGPAKN